VSSAEVVRLSDISPAGLKHPYHAEEFDQAIMDLARAISMTAMDNKMIADYAPVLGHLVKARRIVQEKFLNTE
jgi:hypothetical protein